LVKRGDEVFVSVREAVRGGDLGELRRTVSEEFAILDERARAAHSAVAKLEASFLRGYLELVEGRE
jgi:F-type H+-transporting ATPase subunit epsilon